MPEGERQVERPGLRQLQPAKEVVAHVEEVRVACDGADGDDVSALIEQRVCRVRKPTAREPRVEAEVPGLRAIPDAARP